MLAMTPEIETARELATHANDIKHLQDDVDAMKEDVAAIRATLVEIQKTLSEAKGGLRVLIAVGSFVGGIVGAVIGFFGSKVH